MAQGMDHCFDCASEAFIFEKYIAKHNTYMTVKKLSDQLSYVISHGRNTLATYIPKRENNRD